MDASNDLPGFSLREKTAIVTGAGQGLGLAIARALQAAGAHVVVAELNEETGQNAADEIETEFIQVDVTDSASVRELVETVRERHDRVDVMVNGAGVAAHVPAEEMSDEEWRSIMSVNLDGVFWCCREAGKVMLEQGSGAIVNVASMSGIISNRPQSQAHYNASKAAVIMLTKSLAGEWASRGVRVNAVSPGYIDTPLVHEDLADPELNEAWLSGTPMGRPAQPEEIAPAVVYLASEASSFATGSNLVIDGGYTIW